MPTTTQQLPPEPAACAGPDCAPPAGSALFQRCIASKDDALMLKVWGGTPWMVEAKTESPDSTRWREIMDWCEATFGPEAWPIHGHPGRWHSGGATVSGWTWMGFDTEEAMAEFQINWHTKQNVQGEAQPPATKL